MNKQHTLTIGWLYPTLMSTYGDRGNIICLTKRCFWRGIAVTVLPIDVETKPTALDNVDLIFGGGAQDREQEIVMNDLMGNKGDRIINMINNDIPALFVCGSPQLMGKYYEPAEGKRINGLGIFDMTSVHPGKDRKRCIGNIVAKINWQTLGGIPGNYDGIETEMVGFENHGGRTYLGKDAVPLATVMKGNGNNGTDGTEGAVYKNAIGSYLHGPLLPKNPHIADYLIQKALAVKYGEKVTLKKLDDSLEIAAHKAVVSHIL